MTDVVKGLVEQIAKFIRQDLDEGFPVLVVDQPIAEYSVTNNESGRKRVCSQKG